MATEKEQRIANAIANKYPDIKVDQVTFYGLNGGWQAFVRFYSKEDREWYDECVLLGDDIGEALRNIEADETNPKLNSLE